MISIELPQSAAVASPPRITRIEVKKLFGVLDHPVDLKTQDRVTIVHGINGVGKTKLLELTAALTRGQVWRLMEVPFEDMRIELDDGTAIDVHRDASIADAGVRLSRTKRRANVANIEIKRIEIESGECLAEWSTTVDDPQPIRRVDIPAWLKPLSDGRWVDTRMNRLMTARDASLRFGIDPRAMQARTQIPTEKLAELVPCKPAHLIETQRLLRVGGRRVQPAAEDDEASLVVTVHEIAAELKQTISSYQNEFFKTTQGLDRTLTERVLQADINSMSLGEALRSRLEALEEHRGRLERVGLLEAGTFGPKLAPADAGKLTGDRALMIAVHTEDAEKKFRILDPLAIRLELLLQGMNEKLAGPKRLVLDSDRNLSVQRAEENIALDQLSSGEQHELVLLYDLAFRVQPNTLVLIDEPELSLHPIWQEQFLDDILKIAKNGAFDVLLATHSPYIIGNRNDLCIELKAESRA